MSNEPEIIGTLDCTKLTFASYLTIQTKQGALKINLGTGVVEIPDGCDLDAASLEFWKAVGKLR